MSTVQCGAQPEISTAVNDDVQLVSASRRGDREAFGEIVRRYQGMVSGLIYAACGDLHRSEDLAQETFLSAWKSLSGLREPKKLAAWLCQIARHRTQDQFRKSNTERVGLGGFWTRMRDSAPPPDEAMIAGEEEAVLWRALEQVAQPYRETLVLYYRQGQSTEQVAAALETSEASVRQRLARGREMLRSQVADMIERNLESTTPQGEFAIAVVAALPAIAPEIAAGSAVTATGSTAAHSLSALGWLATAAGLWGAASGTLAAMRESKTPAERKLTVRFLVRLWVIVAVFVPACIATSRLSRHWATGDAGYVTLLSVVYSAFWGAIATLVIVYQRESQRLREVGRPSNIGLTLSVGIAVGPAIGALAWMIQLALAAGDEATALAVVTSIAAVGVCSFIMIQRWPTLVMLVDTIAFAGVIAVVLSLRLDAWVAGFRGVDIALVNLPVWIVDIVVAGLIAWVAGVTWPRGIDSE